MHSHSTCSVEGCTNPVLAKGWCSLHYQRWTKTGSLEKQPPKRAHNALDLVGKTFGRLTVLERSLETNEKGSGFWNCLCDCGNKTTVRTDHLTGGRTVSCGCVRDEINREHFKTHGMTHTQIWDIWWNMLQRCENPLSESYHHYGGRGITVCERWHTFEMFYKDMGNKPTGMSLERLDNDAGYSPDNVVWADRTTQARNTRANLRWTFQGVTKTPPEWEEELGISANLMRERVKNGWSIERALTTPVDHAHLLKRR